MTAAAERAGQLAREAGGFAASSEETGGPKDRRASVTLKVPGDRFDSLVDAVAFLGDTRSKQIGTEDVTDQVDDLEARLRAGRAAADRLQQASSGCRGATADAAASATSRTSGA